MRVPDDIGARIRRLRQARGLSAAQLAICVGRTEQTVVKWELGYFRPSDPAIIVSLAAALDATLGDLVDGDHKVA